MAKLVQLIIARRPSAVLRQGRDPADPKAASALTLDLASRIVMVLDCGIEDLLEVVEQ
jgi:hypothetical protein